MKIPKQLLDHAISHVETSPEQEACGLFLADGKGQLSRILKCTNLQDQLHRDSPEDYPRTSKTAYAIDPKQLLNLQKDLRKSGETIAVIYHSHIEGEAYFSEEDIRMALCDGEPIYPDVQYLVFSVVKGRVQDYAIYAWSPKEKQFKKVEILSLS